jgi:hypothetical protein
MRVAQWIKKLGGHAGELFVCAELSKRGIASALLPDNFPHDDILIRCDLPSLIVLDIFAAD